MPAPKDIALQTSKTVLLVCLSSIMKGAFKTNEKDRFLSQSQKLFQAFNDKKATTGTAHEVLQKVFGQALKMMLFKVKKNNDNPGALNDFVNELGEALPLLSPPFFESLQKQFLTEYLQHLPDTKDVNTFNHKKINQVIEEIAPDFYDENQIEIYCIFEDLQKEMATQFLQILQKPAHQKGWTAYQNILKNASTPSPPQPQSTQEKNQPSQPSSTQNVPPSTTSGPAPSKSSKIVKKTGLKNRTLIIDDTEFREKMKTPEAQLIWEEDRTKRSQEYAQKVHVIKGKKITQAELELLTVFAILPNTDIPNAILVELLKPLTALELKGIKRAYAWEMLDEKVLHQELKRADITYEQYLSLKGLLAENDPFLTVEETLKTLVKKQWLIYDPHYNAYKLSFEHKAFILTNHPNIEKDCKHFLRRLADGLEYDNANKKFLSIDESTATIYIYYAESVLEYLKTPVPILSNLAHQIASYCERNKDIKKASLYYEKNYLIAYQVYDQQPQSTDIKYNFVFACKNLARLYYQQRKNTDEVIKLIEKSITLNQDLVQAFPKRTHYQEELANGFKNLEIIYDQLKLPQKALVVCEQKTLIIQKTYEHHKNDWRYGLEYVKSLLDLARKYKKANQLDQSLAFAEKSYQLCKKIQQAFPNNLKALYEFMNICRFLGDLHYKRKNMDVALEFYHIYRKQISIELKQAPTDFALRYALSSVYKAIGFVYQHKKDLKESLNYLNHSHNILKQLYDEFPKKVLVNMAESYKDLGHFHETQMQDKATAQHYYRESQPLILDLIEAHPNNENFPKYLKWLEGKIV